MNVVQGYPQISLSAGSCRPVPAAQGDDPVTQGLRESARRMTAIAVFSGVINVLMLSGSLYMLQVYDRVIPSRNIATLLGLSLIVLFAYLMQGYFDALRSRMLCRVATLFDVGLQEAHPSRVATLPLRGVKPMLMQQPLRDLDQVRALHVGHGADGVSGHALDPDLSHRVVSVSSGDRHDRAARYRRDHRDDAADRADVARRGQGRNGQSAQRQVLADATQRNAEVIRALGMLDRFTARWSRANERYLQENIRATDVYAKSRLGRESAALCAAVGHARASAPISSWSTRRRAA